MDRHLLIPVGQPVQSKVCPRRLNSRRRWRLRKAVIQREVSRPVIRCRVSP